MAKIIIFRHVENDQKWRLEVSSMHQTRDGMGEMGYNQIDHIQVIFLHDIQNRAISPLKIAVVRGNWLD